MRDRLCEALARGPALRLAVLLDVERLWSELPAGIASFAEWGRAVAAMLKGTEGGSSR